MSAVNIEISYYKQMKEKLRFVCPVCAETSSIYETCMVDTILEELEEYYNNERSCCLCKHCGTKLGKKKNDPEFMPVIRHGTYHELEEINYGYMTELNCKCGQECRLLRDHVRQERRRIEFLIQKK